MNPNWLGVFSALLSLAAFFAARRLARDLSIRTRTLLAILASLAALPGASFALHYTHLFPEQAWYYQFRSLAGTELLVIFIGIAGGLFATILPRASFILPVLGVTAFSIAPFLKPFIGPIGADTLVDLWEDDVCLQSTPSTCGAASTATILKQLGVKTTESELAMEAHSYNGGTEAWYLARAARSRGFEVDFDFNSGFSPEDGLPVVVGVRLDTVGHFIPVLGQDGDRFVIGDPLFGRERLSREELHKRYDFTGFHMRIGNPKRQGGN